MKLLQVLNRIPFPPKDGYAIAAYGLSRQLSRCGVDVTMLAMNTSRHFSEDKLHSEQLNRIGKFHSVFVNNSISISNAIVNLFSGKSFHVSRYESHDFREKLKELLCAEKFDIVQLEGVNLCQYLPEIRKNSTAKVILRAHNVEHRIWERFAMETPNLLKKLYLRLMAKRLKKFESEKIHEVDGILAISPEDGRYFIKVGVKKPLAMLPVCIDPEELNVHAPNGHLEFPSLFHIGALNWMPNQSGLRWFLEKIWPEVHQRFPMLKFYIAGRYTPSWILKLHYPNVIVAGEVEDAYQFMNTKAIMIVPLNSGSGMRVKIIEGMALGKVIISTSAGAEGIDCKNGRDILIANTLAEFIAAISICIKEKSISLNLGKNAAALAKEKYSWKNNLQQLMEWYSQWLYSASFSGQAFS